MATARSARVVAPVQHVVQTRVKARAHYWDVIGGEGSQRPACMRAAAREPFTVVHARRPRRARVAVIGSTLDRERTSCDVVEQVARAACRSCPHESVPPACPSWPALVVNAGHCRSTEAASDQDVERLTSSDARW